MTVPSPSKSTEGFVYILINPAWPGHIKVGKTENREKRLSTYQTASPFRDYAFAACKWFADRHTAERQMLRLVNANPNEWARIDSYFAAQQLDALHKQLMEK